VAAFDRSEYVAGRAQLTTDEWIDLLIRSIGLDPTGMEKRLKLLYLLRLIPQALPSRS
jgi:ATP-dependent Lon protease